MFVTEKHTLLHKKITIIQPVKGYRASLDSVFLGASLDAEKPLKILDVGTGVGTVAFVFAYRLKGSAIYGIDIQEPLIACALNASLLNENVLNSKTHFLNINLDQSCLHFGYGSFDAIVTNPPYTSQNKGILPEECTKKLSNHETLPLNEWLDFIHKLLKPRGTLCLIHQTSRMVDIISFLHSKNYAIEIYPLWPKEGRESKRILVKAKKGYKVPLKLLQGLVLHEEDGQYTPKTKRILEQGESLFQGDINV
jgi:tRNA1(Val) A37 N6-methylase TrmN6